MSDNLRVYEMPNEWVETFAAAWRVMEKSLNPAFWFLMKCGKCGEIGDKHIDFVKAKKKKGAILGMQCECGQTIKFVGYLNPASDTFPARLRKKTKSVLRFNGEEPDEVEDPDDYLPLDLA